MAEPSWHGWGLDQTTLSIAPSPEDGRSIALILSQGDDHEVMAHFHSDAHAEDVMAFLDGAFRSTAQANAMLAEKELGHGPEDQEE